MIETKNTIKVLKELRQYTDRPVVQKDINDIYDNTMYKHMKNNKEFNNLPAIAIVEDREEEGIYIYLSDICPEISFVHEILHQILQYEGYPYATLDMNNIALSIMSHMPINANRDVYMKQFVTKLAPALKYLEAMLTSAIHHRELYRRLENQYDLDMEEERKEMFDQKMRRFNLISTGKVTRKNDQYQFLRQQDIVDGLDYFLWKEEGSKLLDKLHDLYPDTYSTLVTLNKKCQKIESKTPKQCEDIGNLILSEIIAYGNRKHLKKEYNDLWRFLKIENRGK